MANPSFAFSYRVALWSDALTQSRSTGGLLLPLAMVWSVVAFGFAEWAVGSGIAFRQFPLLADPRVGPAGFGALAVHAILCKSDRRKRIVLRAGFILEIIRFFFLIRQGINPEVVAFSAGYGFLLAAIIDFVLWREWRSTALAALVPLGMASAPLGLAGIVARMTPLTYDGALYSLDAAFRIQFSRIFGEFVNLIPALRALCLIAYATLPAAIAAGLAFEEYNYRRGVRRGVGVNLLLAYTVSGTIAAALYILCPGTGPYYAFPGAFPSHLPDASHVPLNLAPYAAGSPRNAMPSFHFAWALLLSRSVIGARAAVQICAATFLVLTSIATMATGEHYLIDLVAAVPFVIALEALSAHRYVPLSRRVPAFVAGALCFALWIGIVRRGEIAIPLLAMHPAYLWALATASIAGPLLLGLKRDDTPTSSPA